LLFCFRKIKEKISFLKGKFAYFQRFKLGDIVWAKMPLPKKALKQVDIDHRIRPYLIVGKNLFYIYCFQSSSKKWEKAYNYQEYKINRLRYKITKDSFISLKKVYKIPFWNIKSKYISLQDIDLKNIQKRLEISGSNYKYYIDYKFDDGDVIKIKNQLYYIYTSDNTNLYCLIVYTNKPSNKYEQIVVDGQIYYTKFEKKACFSRKTSMEIVNIAFYNEKEKIKKQIKEYKSKKIKKA